MQVFQYDIDGYCAAERDLCELHKVSEEDETIGAEWAELKRQFVGYYPEGKLRENHEFPDWHHHIRLFWVYLYSDTFYTALFIPRIQEILASAPRSWFAEFECYSPSRESEQLPTGFVGSFLVYKDTVIVCRGEDWVDYQAKLGITQPH